MFELPLIFVSGLLGSGHCIGMCGAFAVAIGWNCRSPADNFIRQAIFSFGRATTYVFLGATVGFVGQRLTLKAPWLGSSQGVLSILAGVLLLLAGLASSGWLPLRWSWIARASACPAAEQFRALLRSPQRSNVLIAGVLTGFLPCGLVYGVLALAGATGHALHGAAVMATFAAGTMPMMIATGCGASLLSLTARTRLLRLAAVCLMLMGVLTVARGATSIASASSRGEPACPFCRSR